LGIPETRHTNLGVKARKLDLAAEENKPSEKR
jgi:hypothetical protein